MSKKVKKYRYNTADGIEFFLKIAEEIYSRHTAHFQSLTLGSIFEKLSSDNKEKLLKICFFYYHRSWKFLNKTEFRGKIDEGFILLGIISVIEATILDDVYKFQFQWFSKNFENYLPVSIKKIKKAEEDYLSLFGIKSAFKRFVNQYLTKIDKTNLLNLIQVWSKVENKFIKMNIDRIAGLIYDLRSSFVHKAEYIPINVGVTLSLGIFNEKPYKFGDFQKIIEIFERGVFNYFYRQSEKGFDQDPSKFHTKVR